MTFLPSVIRADYRGGFRIHLTFNDLSERTVDFSSWLEGPVFEALKDPAYFREFFVDGGTVAWPNILLFSAANCYAYDQSLTPIAPTNLRVTSIH